MKTSIVLSLLATAIALAAQSPPCVKIGDTVTVRGAFMPYNSGVYFMPRAFPSRPFCVDFIAPTHTKEGLPIRVDPQLEGLLSPKLDTHVQLPIYKYVEITGAIIVPQPTQSGSVVIMPSINISRMVDVNAEVRAAAETWLAGCYRWQDENLDVFSKQVPGAAVERTPPKRIVLSEGGGVSVTLSENVVPEGLYGILWTLSLQRCALSATPASKVIFPAPQPVVLVRPESSVPAVPSEPVPALSVDAAKPTSGILCNGKVAVPQNGELVFKNLPYATLRIKFDHIAWQPSFYRQPNGLRTLVMRSIKPGIQTNCDMRWETAQ